MKQKLPFVLLGVGLLIVVGIFLSMKKSAPVDEGIEPIVEESAPEIPFDERPFVTLTPRSDGHWLKLSIQNSNRVPGAASVEYELTYQVSDGRTQGVPGTVKLAGITTIDRDLLLGSESSGKFRYDEGVKQGKLNLKFRNDKGKLLGKLSTDFHLQSGTDTLSSVDRDFSYKLSSTPKKGYFVTLSTFGVIEGVKGEVASGPYGVFTSEVGTFSGKVTLSGSTIYHWVAPKWSEVKSGSSPDLGIFVSVK